VQLNTGHGRHLDVGDKAGRIHETSRCEEFGCGRENVHSVAQRFDEPSHGLAKELIIINDRYQ
jgi:hypothetical protein